MSPAALLVICMIVPNLIAVPIVMAIRQGWIASSDGDATVLGPTVGFIGTSFALLLTLLMVSIWSDQTATQKELFDEMTTIQSMLIEARTVAPDRAAALKSSALKYVDLMKERELDATTPTGGDPAVQRAFEETLRVIHDFEKTIVSDPQRAADAQGFLEDTRQWTEDREERVNKPSGQLDVIMVSVLNVLAIFTVVSIALLPSTTSAWAKWVQTLGTATTVGLGMFLVFYISSHAFLKDGEDQQIARVQEALASSDALPVAQGSLTPPTTATPR
jgi:hypothetical protein